MRIITISALLFSAVLYGSGSLEITPVPEKVQNLRQQADGKWHLIAPYQVNSKKEIIVSAAEADRTIIAPEENSWFTEDSKLPGKKVLYNGSYNRNMLAFDFELPENAVMRPWFLIRATNPDALNFTMEFNRVEGRKEAFWYSVDNQHLHIRCSRGATIGENIKFDEKAYRSMEYLWIPGNKIKLEKGIHTIRYRGGFYFCNLAAVALIPEKAPAPSMTPEFSKRKEAEKAQIDYAPFSARLLYAQLSEYIPGAKLFISVDDSPFYPSMVKRLFGYGRVRLRLRIDKAAARAGVPEVKAVIAPDKRIVLENDDQYLAFDPESGTLNVWQVKNGPTIIPPEEPQKLFKMEYAQAPFKKWTPFAQPDKAVSAELKKDKDFSTLIVKFALMDKVTAVMKVALPAKSGAPMWELSVDNQSQYEIRDIVFPRFRKVSLTMDAEGIRLTRTHDMTGFNHPGALLGFQGRPFQTHPGFQTVGYLAFYTPGVGSFTLQRRMADGYGVRFSMVPDKNNTGADIETCRRYAVEPGKKTTVSYLAGFIRGDEYDCCDLYGIWARSWMDFSNVNTSYTKNIHSLGRNGIFPVGRTANQHLPMLKYMGINGLWTLGGRVAYTPIYLPRLGRPEELRKENELLVKNGVTNFAYYDILGYSDDYATWDHIAGFKKSELENLLLLKPGEAHKGGVRLRNGRLMPWGWAKGKHTSQDNSMCIDDTLWRNYVQRAIGETYYGRYGLSVYTDECNYYMECYNREHDHGAQYGSRMVGTEKMYQYLLKKIRPASPWFSFFGEGAVDFLTQYNEFVIRNGSDGVDGAPMMFALPAIKIGRGCANAFSDGAPDWEDATREYHLFTRNFTDCEFANNIRQFNWHRARICDWMYNGVFRDSAGMSFSAPGVRAKYFIRDEKTHKGVVINFHNPFEKKDVVIRLELKRLPEAIRKNLPQTAFIYDMEGEDLTIQKIANDGKNLIITAPAGKATTAIIAAVAPEAEKVRAMLVFPQKSGQDCLRMSFVNTGKNTVELNAALQLPAGVSVENFENRIKVAPGASREISVKLNDRSKLQGHAAVKLLVNGKEADHIILAPELSNRSFENYPANDLRPDYWGCSDHFYRIAYQQSKDSPVNPREVGGMLDADKPHSGKYSLKLPAKTAPQEVNNLHPPMAGPHYTGSGWPKKPVSLPWYYNVVQYGVFKPGTKYELTFAVRFAGDNGCLRVQAYPFTYRKDVKSYLFATRDIKPEAGERKWFVVAVTFTTPETAMNSYKTPVAFANVGDADCWIDTVNIREISGK
ncbi:MAG: hypothetical protein J6W00_11605 [Lentisphaeria bacterium]|nr:hypothetical protein [Lentisphaeria bacterium]